MCRDSRCLSPTLKRTGRIRSRVPRDFRLAAGIPRCSEGAIARGLRTVRAISEYYSLIATVIQRELVPRRKERHRLHVSSSIATPVRANIRAHSFRASEVGRPSHEGGIRYEDPAYPGNGFRVSPSRSVDRGNGLTVAKRGVSTLVESSRPRARLVTACRRFSFTTSRREAVALEKVATISSARNTLRGSAGPPP